MADQDIFDLSDTLGYDSPFGNWLKNDFRETNENNIKIVDIRAYIDELSSSILEIKKPKSSDSAIVPIKVVVEVTGYLGIIEITSSDGQKRQARKKTFTNLYEAYFNISVAKSFARKDMYNSKKIILTAKVKENESKMVLDERSLVVNVDTNRKINPVPLKDFTKNFTVVIDPGHGYTKGNTGATSKIYTHKIMGEDEEPVKETNGEFKKESSNVLDLPQYVIDDPNKWVISSKEDRNLNERGLVFDISQKLHELLIRDGFNSLLTRNQRVIQGAAGSATRQKRVNLANTNKADYFISVHADGSSNMASSGAHVIYPKSAPINTELESIRLGRDIFKFYNVVQVEKKSPKKDVRGLQVLGKSNKTKKQVLVELGFVTSPRDAKAMFSSIDKIAEQLYQGIMFNTLNSN